MATLPTCGLATAADIVDERQEVVRGGAREEGRAELRAQRDALRAWCRARGFLWPQPPGRLGGWWLGVSVEVELGTHDVFVPDVAGWRIDRVLERPRGKPVRITPDWVCEVLSPSTMRRDLGHKLRTYDRGRVSHDWVAEPIGEVLSVYRWHDTGYVLVLSASPGDVVKAEPFDAIDIDVADLFDDAVTAAEEASGRSLGGFLPPADASFQWESPTQIAERLRVTVQRVGKAITELGLRGAEGLSRAIVTKASHSDRTVTTYLYSPEAVAQIEAHLKG